LSEAPSDGLRGWRTHLFAVVALTQLTGAAWTTAVPPFEGPDELFFYNRARALAEDPQRRQGLLFRVSAPIIRAMSPGADAAAPEYNPAFQFISNARGEVNRFVHDRPVARREHVRTLMAVRVLIVLLAAVTMILVYAAARLTLGNASLAFLVTCVCLWIPQSSFMNAVMHAEAMTRLLAAAVTLAVVAGATRRAPRWLLWLALPIGIGLVPLAERQAFFLAPFAAVSLVAMERTWKARAIAAVMVMVPAAAAIWLVTRYTEAGTDFGPWLQLLSHPLRPFFAADPGRGSIPPDAPYYVFEFLPKLFMGFWGWMGQPSLLLPAWSYAAIAVLMLATAAGLVMRLGGPAPASDDDRRRRLARALLAVGVALMCLPILYGPAVAGRNLWYGRWLFAMLGPIAIGIVLGMAEFIAVTRRHSRRMAVVLGALAACAAAFWLTAPGEAVRALIRANHYGDAARLTDTFRDVPIVLALAAIAAAVVPRMPSWPRVAALPVLCAVLAVLNAVTLVAWVRPLYAPMTVADYVDQIRHYVAAHELAMAADVYASAIKSYPQSGPLRRLADETPRLLVGRGSAGSRALLWERLARGKGLEDPASLFVLAHEARTNEGAASLRGSDMLAALMREAERQPELAEPAALLQLAIEGGASGPDVARQPIDAGHGRHLASALRNGEVMIEGLTHRPAGAGTQLVVYFRPRGDVTNRRLWLSAYPVGTTAYIEIEPTLAPAVWKPGELGWAAFELPSGSFHIYVGIWVGTDRGGGTPLGVVP
jgi:hypothetical protein